MADKSVVDITNLEHDATAIAKKVVLTDESGNPINDSNPLKVDTELTLDGITIDNINIQDISSGTQTNDVKITLDGESVLVTATDLDIRDLTSVSDSVSAVQSGTWNIGTVTTLPDIDINDISKGTQTNDVKITLDSEEVIIGGFNASIDPIRSDLEGVGDLTVETSEVEIVVSGTPTVSIRIRADTSNTGIIFIGKTGVLSDGTNDFIRLGAGDELIMPYDDSTNALFAISDTVSQTINIGALL